MKEKGFYDSLKTSFRSLIRLLSYAKGYRAVYLLGVFLQASQGLLRTVVFGLGIYAILNAAVQGDVKKTFHIGSTVLIVSVLLILLNTFGAWLLDDSVVKISAKIRISVMEHLNRLPLSWFDRQHSGDLMSRMLSDFEDGIQKTLMVPLQTVVNLLLSGIGSIIAMFALNWQLALILIGVSLISMLLTLSLVTPNRRVSRSFRENNAEASQSISNIVASKTILRIHGLYEFVLSLLEERIEILKQDISRQGRLRGAQSAVGQGVTLLVYGAVILLGLLGWHDIPALVATIQLSSGPIGMFTKLGNTLVELQNTLTGAERIFEILDTPEQFQPERVEWRNKEPYRVEKLNYAYESGLTILNDVTFSIKENSLNGVYGESGSGKSTLFKVLSGLYDYKGKISVYGVELREISLSQLSEVACFIPQSPYLFYGTVAYNIAMGNPQINRSEVEDVAKLVGAHDFILSLPDGYDTILVEGGSNLSIGQKQRIALARALAKRPKLLLLDEPTSALDNENAAHVMRTLSSLKNTTVLIATHSTSSKSIFNQTIEVSLNRR